MKFKLYRHIAAIAILLIIGLRFGKIGGLLLVMVLYLALNMDTIKRAIKQKYGKF